MLILIVTVARADWNYDRNYGFAVETRTDAPTDANIIYDAGYMPIVTVTEGPGAPFVLEGECIRASFSYADPHTYFALTPPEGGWVPDSTYTLAADTAKWGGGDLIPFSFSTGPTAAEPPAAPTVISVSATEWIDDTEYDWGCCAPTRTVTVVVTSNSKDPWAYVSLRGDWPGPSQLSEDPVYDTLDVGIGPGTHALSYLQWSLGDQLWPYNFYVAGFSSSGAFTTPQIVEIDVAPDDTGSGPLDTDSTSDDTASGADDTATSEATADGDPPSDDPKGCSTFPAPAPAGASGLIGAILIVSSTRRSTQASRKAAKYS